MPDFFKSPSSTPTWQSPTGVDEARQGFLSSLENQRVQSGVTQGPTALQNTGAQMLTGLMGPWQYGREFNIGSAALQNAAQTGLPYDLGNLQSLEQQRMQQLPYEMAGVTEQLTARGMGGDTDLARILGETAGRAQTDIAATLAPYYLQAGQGQANRQIGAAQQLLPYAQLPVTTALGAVNVGNTMREQIEPSYALNAQLLAQLLGQGGLAQTSYGPSTGSQLLQAGAQYLPWLVMSGNLPNIMSGFKSALDPNWWTSLFGGGTDPSSILDNSANTDWLYPETDLYL